MPLERGQPRRVGRVPEVLLQDEEAGREWADSELLGEGTPSESVQETFRPLLCAEPHQRSAAIVAADRVSKPEFLQPDIVPVR